MLVDTGVDGLQQGRGLVALALHANGALFEVQQPLPGVGVTRRGRGLQPARQRGQRRHRLLTLGLQLGIARVDHRRIHRGSSWAFTGFIPAGAAATVPPELGRRRGRPVGDPGRQERSSLVASRRALQRVVAGRSPRWGHAVGEVYTGAGGRCEGSAAAGDRPADPSAGRGGCGGGDDRGVYLAAPCGPARRGRCRCRRGRRLTVRRRLVPVVGNVAFRRGPLRARLPGRPWLAPTGRRWIGCGGRTPARVLRAGTSRAR